MNSLLKQDLIVFPYQKSNESSSASARQALSTFKPVLVTPHPIFDDISSCVYSLPGFAPGDISAGILNWFENVKYNSQIVNLKSLENAKLVETFRFSKLSLRLTNLIYSLELNTNN